MDSDGAITRSPSGPATGDFVLAFGQLGRGDVDFAGGKGANLGELTSAGLPVPPGFVIGAPAYAAFCEQSGLRERVAARLADLDVEDTAALEAAAREVREEIEREPIPDWLGDRIRGAYAALVGDAADAPVAVRSSATAEDTESASFAGMNSTPSAPAGPRCSGRARSSTAPSAASARPRWTSPSSSSGRSSRPAPG